jgi:hypothetical protein
MRSPAPLGVFLHAMAKVAAQGGHRRRAAAAGWVRRTQKFRAAYWALLENI